MCSECSGYLTCHPMCPNAKPPAAVYRCEYCGGEIYEGEEYFHTISGNYYHLEDCAMDVAVSLLIKENGATTGVVKNETHNCKYCNEVIEDGDDYLRTSKGNYYHLDCAADTALGLLINECGEDAGTAEADDYDWGCNND